MSRPMHVVYTTESAERVDKCLTLLDKVPDDAPCFSSVTGRSDTVNMALAVLAGDMQAAAALADSITERHGRLDRTFHAGEDVVAFYEEKIAELAEECIERVKVLWGTLKADQVKATFKTLEAFARDALMSIIQSKTLGPFGRGCTTAPPVDAEDMRGDPGYPIPTDADGYEEG